MQHKNLGVIVTYEQYYTLSMD